MKTQFLRVYEKQIKQTLSSLTMDIESKIRMNQYKTPQDFLQDINKMKQEYLSQVSYSTFKNKELILSQECERIVFKGMENLFMNNSNSYSSEKRHLTERVNYLEQQLSAKK